LKDKIKKKINHTKGFIRKKNNLKQKKKCELTRVNMSNPRSKSWDQDNSIKKMNKTMKHIFLKKKSTSSNEIEKENK
jgi:hypothetical protein